MLTNELFLQKLGLYLRDKRTAAQLTQRDIAKEMGYTSPQFISNWERGLTAPPLMTLKKLIKMYKCDAKEVYDFIAEEQLKILRKALLD